MLTPEYLEKLEENKILDLYNQLNIDITSDIIKRVSKTGNISSYNKKQLRVLVEANGNDVFKDVLLKTQLLDDKVKTELTKIYENMAKTDLNGYKTLFKYRNIDFKLTGSQLKLLNKGILNNAKSLDNLTNTVAFSSKKMYTDSVNKAYMQVISGGKDYESAVLEAYQNLANEGVTLKDSLDRNVGLDTAIRRNIRAGIQQTANIINRDIDNKLGCDGVETTAHEGARPTHQVWQGRQFALKQSDARKYGVDLWDKYKDELNDYNCRHTYFGIILGISEPVYSKKELYDMNNRKVLVDGKYMDYYDATQKMHYYESNIRNYKRQSETYKKALENDNNNVALKKLLEKSNNKIREWQAKYTDFSKQVGIAKDSNKTGVILNNHQKSSIISAIEKEQKKIEKSKLPKTYRVNNVPLQNNLIYFDGKILPKETTIEKVTIISGKGTSSNIRDVNRLINAYGGSKEEWQKVTGVVNGKNYSYEIHWYQLDDTQYEQKIKNVKKR